MAGTIRQVDPVAQRYMAEARQEESRNNLKKAVKRYEKITDKHPLAVEAPYARFRTGQLREQLGDPIDAFDEYQKLIELYPDSPYYSEALKRQRELAFGAATGTVKNKVFWTFNVSMDSSIVTQWLNHVCDNAPFSSTAPEAKKILGDYLSKREHTAEAIAAYQSIGDNYPNSSLAPGALIRVAELYMGAREGGDQSYSNLAKAQETYEDFLQRYPHSSLAPQARQGLKTVRGLIVQNKLENGEYYMNRMKDHHAAIFCFEEVVAAEKENPQAAAKARQYLTKLKGTANGTASKKASE